MKKFPAKYGEMHIVHHCNLSCRYCSHYCDIGYNGVIPLDTAREWLLAWTERIDFKRFYLLGGEPLLHPELDKYIRFLHEIMPKSRRQIITNGLLLSKIENLLPLFIDTNTHIRFSIHPVRKSQEKMFRDSLAVAERWLRRGLLVTIIPYADNWRVPYMGAGRDILPYAENDPEKSFANTCLNQPKCINLHEGKLWKCSRLAYLPQVFDKLTHKDEWEKYVRYVPLSLDASDEELEHFINSEDTSLCDLCPTADHIINRSDVIKEDGDLVLVEHKRNKLRTLWRGVGKARYRLRRIFH